MRGLKRKRKDPHRRRCLVLNADAQPLAIWPPSFITAREAVEGIYKDRYIVVDEWPGEFFRSPSTAIAIPKVVMLRHYAPVAHRPKQCRANILLRDRYRCQYCGERFPSEELTYDHVIPRSKGGKTEWENILTACVACNARKKNLDAKFSGPKGARGGYMRPLKMPKRPTTAELLRAGLELMPASTVQDFGSWLYWQEELAP